MKSVGQRQRTRKKGILKCQNKAAPKKRNKAPPNKLKVKLPGIEKRGARPPRQAKPIATPPATPPRSPPRCHPRRTHVRPGKKMSWFWSSGGSILMQIIKKMQAAK